MTRFLNGTAPDYLGYQFTTATDLIDTIQSELVAKGWTSLTKEVGTSLFIRGVTAVNAHNCWLEFTVTGTAPNLTLNMQGWKEEAKTNGSGALFPMTFTSGSANSLWITSEQDALNICIFNKLGTGAPCRGYHFGFLNRIDETDTFAIYIGAIRTHYFQPTAPTDRPRVCVHFIQGTNWATFSNANAAGLNNGTLVQTTPQAGTFDLLTRSGYDQQMLDTNVGTGSVVNSNNPQFGAINALDNKQVIDPRYYYMEFRGATTNVVNTYGNFDGNAVTRSACFRGVVKNAATGGAGLSKAFQILDTDGKRYLSVGDATLGWQLMRIS